VAVVQGRRAPGRVRSRHRAVLVLLLCALLGCSSRGGPTEDQADGIRVASFDFIESRVLGELYASALESAGLPVTRRLALGPREVVGPALEQGHVDLVPEYAGSALRFLTGATDPSPDTVRADLDTALAGRGLQALAFAPGQDQNGVVVTTTTADRHGLRQVSDLAAVADRFTFGGPPECSERPLCLLGLRERYGLTFERFVPFDSRAATAASLLAAQIDVGMLETVDAHLSDGRLRLLRDDRALQPPENIVPVLRRDVLAEHGSEVARTLDAVTATLTTPALVELDRQAVLDRRPLDAIARDWLQAHGLA
jgi:osmoprotectant transport system substrate-binding protein